MNTVLLSIVLVPIIEIYLFIKIGGQIGALNMALNNYSTDKILFHYFQNTKLKKIYD